MESRRWLLQYLASLSLTLAFLVLLAQGSLGSRADVLNQNNAASRRNLADTVDRGGSVANTSKPQVGDGYWFAVGSQILDSRGNVVEFSGINWNGFDAENCVVDGIWDGRSIASHLDQMKEYGFNVIRLNFASSCLMEGAKPAATAIDLAANPGLEDKTVLEIMDVVVDECKLRGIRVILSNIRLKPATPPDWAADGGVWFDDFYPESAWLNNWKALAWRYRGNPTVIGVDLYNEPHSPALSGVGGQPTEGLDISPVWAANGVGEPYNWRTAAKRAADIVQKENPNLLIFVQGMAGDRSWWGGDLSMVKEHPLVLNVPDKLVYSIHEYGPLVFDQPWFHEDGFPNNMETFWDTNWGFLVKENIAPVWVGEWGSFLPMESREDMDLLEVNWANAFRDYLRNNKISWTWFTWGPNSKDTGGILDEDWTTALKHKTEFLQLVMHPGFGPSLGQNRTVAQPHAPLNEVPQAEITPDEKEMQPVTDPSNPLQPPPTGIVLPRLTPPASVAAPADETATDSSKPSFRIFSPCWRGILAAVAVASITLCMM